MPARDLGEIAAAVRAGDQVFLDRQVLEDPAALEHLHDAALDDIVRRQPVEPLAVELDGALGDLAALGCATGRRSPSSVVVLPAPLAPSSVVICPSSAVSETPFSTRITPS